MRLRCYLVCVVALVGCERKRETRAELATRAPPDSTEILPYVENGPCPYAFVLPEDRPAHCSCPGSVPGNFVVGTGVYSYHSEVCTAARHAGALDPTTHMVTVQRTAGCASYVGSARNGITSYDDGAVDGSIYFPGFGEPKCVSGQAIPAGGDALECPTVLPLAMDGTAAAVRCRCSPPVAAGPVWGSGPYALDSSPCAAAVHAGAIDPSGGIVELERVAGCQRYGASVQNGVTARASDATPEAFRIAGTTVVCP